MTSWFYQRTVPHSEGSAHEWGEPARAENRRRAFRGPGFRLWGSNVGQELQLGELRRPEGAGPQAMGLTGAEDARTLNPLCSGGGGAAVRLSRGLPSLRTGQARAGAGLRILEARLRARGPEAEPRGFGKGRGQVPSNPKRTWPQRGFGLWRSRHLTGTPEGRSRNGAFEGGVARAGAGFAPRRVGRHGSVGPDQNVDRGVRDAPAGPGGSVRGGSSSRSAPGPGGIVRGRSPAPRRRSLALPLSRWRTRH